MKLSLLIGGFSAASSTLAYVLPINNTSLSSLSSPSSLSSLHPPIIASRDDTGIPEPDAVDKPHGVSDPGRFRDRSRIDGSLTLINATPYVWRKGYVHSYQMQKWNTDWPEEIAPGTVAMVKTHTDGDGWRADCAGEVVYNIEGTKKPMSFMWKFSNKHFNGSSILYLDEMTSMGVERDSEIWLGHSHHPGGIGYTIAGEEDHFISHNNPVPWMRTMLPELKRYPLRQIVMPRSHHTGMYKWKGNRNYGFGQARNTMTHHTTTYSQLKDSGIRVIDLRPTLRKGLIYESHGSNNLKAWHGSLGAKLRDMIYDINRFQREYPGELIIVDVDAQDSYVARHRFKEFKKMDEDADARKMLYQQLLWLENRLPVPYDEDLTEWPLEKFIKDGKSAVLVRVSDSWRKKDHYSSFPGEGAGFVTDHNFPTTHQWSDTNEVARLADDQVKYFPQRLAKLHIADWILTYQLEDLILWKMTITEMAQSAWLRLFISLWPSATSEKYPNWIAVDDVHGDSLKTLVIAINHCLVARKCGDLGGKVDVHMIEPES